MLRASKSILDLPLTLEALETLGVPVLSYRTAAFPAFYSRDLGLAVDAQVDEPTKTMPAVTSEAKPANCSRQQRQFACVRADRLAADLARRQRAHVLLDFLRFTLRNREFDRPHGVLNHAHTVAGLSF